METKDETIRQLDAQLDALLNVLASDEGQYFLDSIGVEFDDDGILISKNEE